MFEDADPPFKMSNYFSDKMSHVKPTEVFQGHRADTARKNGQMTQVLISDTCWYISIIDTIRFLFRSEKMQSLYMESNRTKMRDYCNGAQFVSLQIQLYFDDVEVLKPIDKFNSIQNILFVPKGQLKRHEEKWTNRISTSNHIKCYSQYFQ